MTKVNDDKIQLFCAFGSFFQNKNMGGVLAEFVCVSHSSDQAPTHKSETCAPNQDGWKARMASAGLSGTLELPGLLNHYYRGLSTRQT